MANNKIENRILAQLRNMTDLDFQGFKMQAYVAGKKRVDLGWGKTYRYYDIASLTKIIFTTSWFIQALEFRKISLKSSVQSILPWYKHSQVNIGQLLSHSAGNKWWQPFYKDISTSLPSEQAYQQMESFCRKAPLAKGGKAVYSDIDFYLLGSIMSKVEQKPLLQIWDNLKSSLYPKSHFHFNGRDKSFYPVQQYAPTEKCSWRKKVLRGQVHDENCWAMGGVAPHAGLFAEINDLAQYGLVIRSSYLGEEKSLLKEKTLKMFSKRSMPEGKGDWGFGFMLPSRRNSSAGELFSRSSFGHTGFTGTSFWFDHKRDLFVCILSNRVYPTRNNKDFVFLRPKLHDWFIEALEGET